MSDSGSTSRMAQLHTLRRVARYRPAFSAAIVVGGVVSALLEGIGLSFILPIVEIVQSGGDPAAEADGMMGLFVSAYRLVGIPFTLGTVVAGVSLVLVVRWTLTFTVRWLREVLVVKYTRDIQVRSFDHALDARIEYFDAEGSDDILNAIVTQAEYAGRVIKYVVNSLEQGFLAAMYLAVALVLAPRLTLFAIVLLGGFSLLFRHVLESGYDLGDDVAEANREIQQAAQAGTQGIRDTKLFGLKSELSEEFLDAADQFADASVTLQRNQEAIKNFYNLLTAVSVFLLIYLAVTVAQMSLGSLGIFLFAMFRLGPKASNINSIFYRVENNLPHLIRMQAFVDELAANSEPDTAETPVPDTVDSVAFDQVTFGYDAASGPVLSDLSLSFERGEFIGFVGPSGAGKSTIVALLSRMYEPDSRAILADDRPIANMDIDAWRSHIAVVRQDPFIFNDTLRYNLTIGNRDATEADLDRVCRIARVDEFLVELADGYETELGDEGVRLSGGQKQRVALARALLKDSDLLVLDEATSNLDSDLEQQVQAAIEEMDREYAIIGIAHRLSTIKNADRIYTLDDGSIIEMGTHKELIDSEGKYSELYAIQSRD